MFGVPYDDPKWDKLLDQLTLEEAMYIFSFGGPTIPGACLLYTSSPSVGRRP